MQERLNPNFSVLGLGAIRPSGWMLDQIQRDLQGGLAGHLDQLTSCINLKGYKEERVDSFEISASGMVHDTPRTWWSGEQTAFWLDGFVRMAYLSGQADAIQRADQYMKQLLDSQDEDGYLGIYTSLSRFKHKKENGEFWVQSRIFMVMLAYYELTGKIEYLDAVAQALRITMRHYGPEASKSYFNNEEPAGGTGHGLMIVEPLEWMYRITGEKHYLSYALWCYEDYCSANDIRDTDNQIHNLLDLEKPFMWHAPHTTEHLRIPLWLAFASEDPLLKQASEHALTKIVKYLVPSGTCIGDENIEGRAPLPSLPYEYCGITELTISLQSALQKSGQAEWGDRIERIAFNAAQGARLPDGKAISYLTKDNRHSAAVSDGHQSKFQYSPTHETGALCCAGNAVRYMPHYLSGMWMRTEKGDQPEGLAALLYGPCRVKTKVQGVNVDIHTITNYPFDESLVFVIKAEEEVEYPLYFRIPKWSVKSEVIAEGVDITEMDGYIILNKRWKKKDQVQIDFKSEIAPYVAANGEITLNRGVLLYAWPIPEQRVITKRYGDLDFVDFDAISQAKLEEEKYSLDSSVTDFGFTYARTGSASIGWEEPVCRLEGSLTTSSGDSLPVSLVPIGNTILRQVSFPTLTKSK